MAYDAMPAGPEMDQRAKVPYHLTKAGKITRRAYYEKTKHLHMKRKREYRKRYAQMYPERVLARHLLGQAVKMGPKPPNERTRSWGNRWEFHHPDYSRPYYGCWLKTPQHRLIDLGKVKCPPCIDYEPRVRFNVLLSWGLNESK